MVDRIIRAIISLIGVVVVGVAILISKALRIEDSVVLIGAEVANIRICSGHLQALGKTGLKVRIFK